MKKLNIIILLVSLALYANGQISLKWFTIGMKSTKVAALTTIGGQNGILEADKLPDGTVYRIRFYTCNKMGVSRLGIENQCIANNCLYPSEREDLINGLEGNFKIKFPAPTEYSYNGKSFIDRKVINNGYSFEIEERPCEEVARVQHNNPTASMSVEINIYSQRLLETAKEYAEEERRKQKEKKLSDFKD